MPGTAPQIVTAQVEFYEQQVEHWMKDRHSAQVCVEVEQLVRLGLAALENVRISDRDWANTNRQNRAAHRSAGAKRIGDLYRRWLKACKQLLPILEHLEGKHYRAEGADSFRRAIRDVTLTLSIDPARIPVDLDVQGSITLKEMRDALHTQA